MKKVYHGLIAAVAGLSLLIGISSCDKYLNVVPDDGIPTIDMAFNLRSTAIRYLATCYAYMPLDGAPAGDSGFLTGDELWDLVGRIVSNTSARVPNSYFQIARGFQSASSVRANDWALMYQGIRCCDILVDNIDRVPDMTEMEKKQWKAEATFLKAYYHFNLIRKWGPVPIIRHSLPMDASVEEVRVYREPIDTCFNFVMDLLDQAYEDLPLENQSNDEFGRVTQPICAGEARLRAVADVPSAVLRNLPRVRVADMSDWTRVARLKERCSRVPMPLNSPAEWQVSAITTTRTPSAKSPRSAARS